MNENRQFIGNVKNDLHRWGKSFQVILKKSEKKFNINQTKTKKKVLF